MSETLMIGQLADATGVGVETLRYYERRGLLPEPPRSGAGYRLYPPSAIDRLAFIRNCQGLGFTLREIAELLDLRVDETTACSDVEVRITEKVTQIDTRIADLQAIRDSLERFAASCRDTQQGRSCRFLDSLG